MVERRIAAFACPKGDAALGAGGRCVRVSLAGSGQLVEMALSPGEAAKLSAQLGEALTAFGIAGRIGDPPRGYWGEYPCRGHRTQAEIGEGPQVAAGGRAARAP